MKYLDINSVKVHNQNCLIFQNEYRKSVILKDNTLSSITPHEFEILRQLSFCEKRYHGYIGDVRENHKGYSNFWSLFISHSTFIGKFDALRVYKIADITLVLNYNLTSSLSSSDKNTILPEYAKDIVEVGRLLCNGLFYYAVDIDNILYYDLTKPFDQSRQNTLGRDYFLWNRGLTTPWYHIDIYQLNYITPIICGSVDIQTIYVTCSNILGPSVSNEDLLKYLANLGSKNQNLVHAPSKNSTIPLDILLISRLSWMRAGTRLQVRGLNDYGFVANFVETEQIISSNRLKSCLTQIRGSVPLFWSQEGLQIVSHKFEYDRTFTTSRQAFIKHFERLKKDYSDLIACNLLGSKKDELTLSKSYNEMCKDVEKIIPIKIYNYDFNTLYDASNIDLLWNNLPEVKKYISEKLFHVCILRGDRYLTIRKQDGVVRTNCVDCLDRTNAFQSAIAITLLDLQLEYIGITNLSMIETKNIHETIKQMWFNNGNNCSLNYAGTNALEKTKSNVSSILRDTKTSLKRAFMNNFMDGKRNTSISYLCSINQRVTQFKFDYSSLALSILPYCFMASSLCPSELLYELLKKCDRFVDRKDVYIHVGTWNIAGGVERVGNQRIFKSKDIETWLLDACKEFPQYNFRTTDDYSCADLIVVGLQEMIDLTATNILMYNNLQMFLWANELKRILSRDKEFILVSLQQLVGVSLFIFCSVEHVNYITDISICTVKTGLGGATGNKGAIGISMSFYSTQICFVCAHLAAGTSPNSINQRNQDFVDISNQLIFDRERSIFSHDIIIWLGDLNYRINMSNDQVRSLSSKSQINNLVEQDQLLLVQQLKKAFATFKEGQIKFLPTYKYEYNSFNYDSSDKARTPSYTDRILFWESQGTVFKFKDTVKQVAYGRTESTYSDHRPVYALYEIGIKKANIRKLLDTYVEVLEKAKYGQLSVEYIIESEPCVTETYSVQSMIENMQQIVPGFVLYRLISDKLILTYPCVTDLREFPKQIRFPGYKLALNILPSRLLKDVEEPILKSLCELANFRPYTAHKKRDSDLIFFDLTSSSDATIAEESQIPSQYTNNELERDLLSGDTALKVHSSHDPLSESSIKPSHSSHKIHSMINFCESKNTYPLDFIKPSNKLKSHSRDDIDNLEF